MLTVSTEKLIIILILLLLTVIVPYSIAGEPTDFKPLFPVDIEHDFPESKETFENPFPISASS